MFRKIKYILFMLLTLTSFVGLAGCAGCGEQFSYPLFHDVEEIQSIQIVQIVVQGKYQTFHVEMIDDCKILTDIEDTSGFIEKFNNDVLFSICLFGDPTYLGHGDYAIKITYINGDFELIGYYAQSKGRREETSDGGNRYVENIDFVCCNIGDFMNFINSFLDEPIVY